MGTPRIDQINVVVADADAAARFLAGLGIAVPDMDPAWAVWAPHHQTIPSSTSLHTRHEATEPAFGIDLDSAAFAAVWGGLESSFRGVVVNIRVDERTDVDRLHELAASLGGRSRKEPYDAFWGSRFAVVEGPGPLLVGLMSVPDPARRAHPPDPASF